MDAYVTTMTQRQRELVPETIVLLRKSVMHLHHAFKPLYEYFQWNRSCDDAVTTLENKATIALPSQTSLTMLEME